MASIGKETLQRLGFEKVIAIRDPATIINGKSVACRSQKFDSLDDVKKFFQDSSWIIIQDYERGDKEVPDGEEVYIRIFPVCSYGIIELSQEETELVVNRRHGLNDPEEDAWDSHPLK